MRCGARFVLSALLILVTGCSAGEESTSDLPEITAEMTAEIAARAVHRACELHCGERAVYVFDTVAGFTAEVGEGQAISDLMRDALSDQLYVAGYVGMKEQDALVAPGGLVDQDSAVIVYIAPIYELDNGVVGIGIGVGTGHDGYRAETHLFRWDGAAWDLVTPEQVDITVTSSVS